MLRGGESLRVGSTQSFLTAASGGKSFLTAQRKRRTWFGYLPVWSEFMPLCAATSKPDWAGVLANLGAGLLIGLREVLGGIVSASLIFSSAGVDELSMMFPFGIGMVWFSTSASSLWYAVFGRLQYTFTAAQDVIGILQSSIIATAAQQLAASPSKIPATALCIICLSAVLTGISSLAVGKMGFGKYMLLLPSPVTSGLLGAIGFVILRSSLQTSSGVQFHHFYPASFEQFCLPNNLAQVGCQLAMVCFMQRGPRFLEWRFPESMAVKKLAGLACQLLPLALFYACAAVYGVGTEALSASGWTYPKQGSGGLMHHWTEYHLANVDARAVLASLPDMPALVLMAVLCTSMGALTITDRFPTGPQGDPNPDEAVDFDAELTTVGASSLLLGLAGGTLTFHTFTVIQLRLDGGTHRIAVLAVAAFIGGAFASGAPIGHLVPKWFLSGLFMNTALHFLGDALLSYKSLPSVRWRGIELPSPQYAITLCGILVSVFFSPATAILTGMVLSIALFLVQTGQSSPVINVAMGNRVVSRQKRPYWEMRTLRMEGDRILLLYLQGHLFFGSVRRLVAVLTAAGTSDRAWYCILSFARVERVDPSAARHLKALTDKGKHRGVRILYCRMNASVFAALVAVGAVTKPDSELIKYMQGLRWRSAANAHLAAEGKTGLARLPLQGRYVDEPDAFTHETDALEYCDGRLVAEFFYGPLRDTAEAPYERYMLAYREAVTKGARLPEWAFEAMNGLPEGAMQRLRGHCEVLESVAQWTELPRVDGALCFILRGAVSLVQILHHAEEIGMAEQRGFSFRQGKRLLKRYPPGSAVGKGGFFLRPAGQIVDPELVPRVIVSSALGPSAEIWILRPRQWEELPQDLQAQLARMLCVQLADDEQHSQLQEH